ncbi:uncharacterized protein LOC112559776 [Pomacea canaliculata]|uniref:uncharacterized protein LOC112559776 n=1 Tax=Pomacea canaliculata TaxID=400727 RepID=UPI000D738CB0|nr:uncharacterized protein LOC112559776 [Pomacea canaliculata]
MCSALIFFTQKGKRGNIKKYIDQDQAPSQPRARVHQTRFTLSTRSSQRMSVAPNYSRRVITRKTRALRLVVYSFFLVTADTWGGGEGHQRNPCTFPTTTGTVCLAHKCLHCNIYKNNLQVGFSVTDCKYCSKDSACCIRWDDNNLLLDCRPCSTDDASCIKCEESCCTEVPPPSNKEAPKSTTTLSLSSSLSTSTHKEDGDGNDVHLSACKTICILGALLAFIVGVIVGLLVAWLRHRKCSNPLQESPANTGMSEMVNTRHDHKDRQEASGNNCEDVHSLAQVLNLPSDVASVLQPETSTVPNDQDSGAGVYSHLRVVSEAETTEYTPLTPPDENNITTPPASQQMMATQHLPNIDEAGYEIPVVLNLV